MDFKYKPAIRIISIIVLAFFTWTFGGLFDIAVAAKTSQGSGVGGQGSASQNPEKKFQKAIEDITSTIEEVGKIGRLEDEKKGKLKTKKTEIESLDIEIKKQFAETEYKIKDLPEVIKQRHKDFVKHYEDNLNELKNNLDAIDKSKTKAETDVAIKKTKAHLDKVKPPKKHIPLDPNKLPHRTVEPIEVPLLNYSEQVSGVSGQEIKDSRQVITNPQSLTPNKPILVASIGSLAGLLSSTIVQSTNQPTPADLAETIEVQFTPEIQAKALELEHNPIKIYNWVRNNIEFVSTYGSIQGANMCLQTKQCNAFDTASLLIALLRASNIPAKYVYGTIELPIEKVKNWVGGFTDANAALTLIASGGIPVTGLTSGGKVVAVRMEHAWIEAWIDYVPSRGAKHREGDTWIPLDASFKQYTYKKGLDIQQITGFDPNIFTESLRLSGTFDSTTGSMTNVNTALIQSKIDEIKNTLNAHIQNLQDPTIGDIVGAKDIIAEQLEILPASLPYKTIVIGSRNSEVSDTLRHKITFSTYDPQWSTQSLTFTYSTAYLAGKRITLAYSPATDNDAQVIESSGGIFKVAPYLVNLKPVLYVEAVPVAVGETTQMGSLQDLSLTFIAPKKNSEIVTHRISASTFAAIGLDLQRIPSELVNQRTTKLDNSKNLLGVEDIPFDDIIGETLNLHALGYFSQVEGSNRIIASGRVAFLKHPSEMLASLQPSISYFWGAPYKVESVGMSVDVKRYLMSTVSLKGNKSEEKAFMLASGNIASAAEHAIFEQTRPTGYQGISAVKAISYANQIGIPIYTIDSNNINNILPLLSVSQDVISDIKNAVASGKIVTIPQRTIQYYDWRGEGYVITDPNTGAGAYMISGGLAGGGTTQKDDPVVSSLEDIISVLNYLANIAPLIRAGAKVGAALGVIGNLIAVISAIVTAYEMYKNTNCGWNALAGGVLDFGLNLLAGYLIASLVPLIVVGGVFGWIAAIFVAIVVTYLLIILEDALLNIIQTIRFCLRYLKQNFASYRIIDLRTLNPIDA